MSVGNWIANHHRVVCVFLLTLAGLNVWISVHLYPHHPHLGVVNAAMSVVLVVGVYLSW